MQEISVSCQKLRKENHRLLVHPLHPLHLHFTTTSSQLVIFCICLQLHKATLNSIDLRSKSWNLLLHKHHNLQRHEKEKQKEGLRQ